MSTYWCCSLSSLCRCSFGSRFVRISLFSILLMFQLLQVSCWVTEFLVVGPEAKRAEKYLINSYQMFNIYCSQREYSTVYYYRATYPMKSNKYWRNKADSKRRWEDGIGVYRAEKVSGVCCFGFFHSPFDFASLLVCNPFRWFSAVGLESKTCRLCDTRDQQHHQYQPHLRKRHQQLCVRYVYCICHRQLVYSAILSIHCSKDFTLPFPLYFSSSLDSFARHACWGWAGRLHCHCHLSADRFSWIRSRQQIHECARLRSYCRWNSSICNLSFGWLRWDGSPEIDWRDMIDWVRTIKI